MLTLTSQIKIQTDGHTKERAYLRIQTGLAVHPLFNFVTKSGTDCPIHAFISFCSISQYSKTLHIPTLTKISLYSLIRSELFTFLYSVCSGSVFVRHSELEQETLTIEASLL